MNATACERVTQFALYSGYITRRKILITCARNVKTQKL